MSSIDIRATTEALTDLIWEKDRVGLSAFVDNLPPADLALIFSRLGTSDRSELLENLDPADAAGLLLNLKELSPHTLLANIPPGAAAEILHELPSNVETDFIAALKPFVADRILELLPEREMDDVRALARYEPDVAGGLMATEILHYPETATVQSVVEDLRLNAPVYANYNVQYIYVTKPDHSLAGVLRVRDLLLSAGETVLGGLIVKDTVTVNHVTPLQDISDLLDRHRFLGLPVVNDEGQLVGVVRRAAVEEAIAQRTARQFRLVQGIVGGEEVRTMPVGVRSGRRLAWLSANIVLNVLAASVIVYFESTLTRLIALAAFLPIISDMSGCSGNQAVAVSMRELSLGLVRPRETLRVWAKEVSVGLINGAALGVLLGLVAWLWRGNPVLGVVVGVALALNTVIAVSIGGTVPLLLKGLGVDPALASGPILTTVTDICGFFLALGLASFALSHGYL
ncbi:MAG: magnesium transporter [Acidobacteriota bacterium]|nr:magnesium transporter [Acidobacteriota bacterium]